MDVKELCLGVLSMNEATGYDIKKYFEKSFRHFFAAGYGSIYPALADLSKKGLVECREQAQDKRPDKKIYQLTDKGREAFRQAITKAKPRHKIRSQYLVLMYFAHMLSPDRLRDIMFERVKEIEELIEWLEEGSQEDQHRGMPGVEFTIGFGLHTLKAARDYIREHGDELITGVEERQHPTTLRVA